MGGISEMCPSSRPVKHAASRCGTTLISPYIQVAPYINMQQDTVLHAAKVTQGSLLDLVPALTALRPGRVENKTERRVSCPLAGPGGNVEAMQRKL